VIPEELARLRDLAILAALHAHADEDPVAFSLRHAERSDWPVRAMAEQLRCRRKARNKIPPWADRDHLYTLRALEQASSWACARFKAGLVPAGRGLDVCAGLGVDACAFAADATVTSWERDPVLAAICAHNCALAAPGVDVHAGDGIAALFEADSVAWVYVDPDRRSDGRRRRGIDGIEPSPADFWQRAVARAGTLLVKLAPTTGPGELDALPPHRRIWVSWRGSCRELLCIADEQGTAQRAVALDDDGRVVHEVTADGDEVEGFAVGPGPLIVIPDPAVRAAGLVAHEAARCGLFPLGAARLLLTGERPAAVAGTRLEVFATGAYHGKKIRPQLRQRGIRHLNVVAPGLRGRAEERQRRLGIRAGGPWHLVLWQDLEGRTRYALGRLEG